MACNQAEDDVRVPVVLLEGRVEDTRRGDEHHVGEVLRCREEDDCEDDEDDGVRDQAAARQVRLEIGRDAHRSLPGDGETRPR